MKKINVAKWTGGRGYLKKVLADENVLGEKGTQVQLVAVAPGDEVAPHHHKIQTEFYHVLCGNAAFVFGGERIKAKPGDAFVCEPGDIHAIVNTGSKSEFLFLVFKTNFKKDDIYWE